MNTVILIPAYKPDEKFVAFSETLIGLGLTVVAVDDGSGEQYRGFFESAEALGVTVVRHEVNGGKGKALRTGFTYIGENMPETEGIVTADCDGQHTPEDIMKVIKCMEENPDTMIIGGRFAEKQDKVPLRSQIGNGLTRLVFRLATGLKIRDTQTGLRGIQSGLIPRLMELKGDRYEYEMNMLLYLKEWEYAYKEIPIATVYINNNEGSHYNTLKDSWRIFVQIFKFCAASAISFAVDYILFFILHNFVFSSGDISLAAVLGDGVPTFLVRVVACFSLAYIVARVVSATVNYVLNRLVVFRKGSGSSWVKYTALAVAVMLIGAFFTGLLYDAFGIPGIICKLIIDLPLAAANYFIQRDWVFKKGKKG